MLNKNELILDKVRSLVAHDLSTGGLLFRLTSLEDPSLNCTAEGEEVTDALGALITTLYRAKKATFSANASLLSLDLVAAQYGAKKEIATNVAKIKDYTYEIKTITVDDAGVGTIQLDNVPLDDIKFIYAMESGEISTAYQAGAVASATEFVLDKASKTITTPTGVTGKVFVEYNFENENAMKVANKTTEFPEAVSMIIYAYFKDKCNENITYSGKIVCPKAKLNPEQVELALTSTGKHPFEFNMMNDYCDEDGELFSIIVSE